jgi:hypothetical protein
MVTPRHRTVYPHPASGTARHEARRIRGEIRGGLADLLGLAGAQDGVHARRARGRLSGRALAND